MQIRVVNNHHQSLSDIIKHPQHHEPSAWSSTQTHTQFCRFQGFEHHNPLPTLSADLNSIFIPDSLTIGKVYRVLSTVSGAAAHHWATLPSEGKQASKAPHFINHTFRHNFSLLYFSLCGFLIQVKVWQSDHSVTL